MTSPGLMDLSMSSTKPLTKLLATDCRPKPSPRPMAPVSTLRVVTSTPAALIPSSTPSPSSRKRSEEHTSELQSSDHLVCRLLLEKKKKKNSPVILALPLNIEYLYIMPPLIVKILQSIRPVGQLIMVRALSDIAIGCVNLLVNVAE